MRELLPDDNLIILRLYYFTTKKKIAASGEGRKPNPNKQRFVAESELGILSIL